MSLYPRNKIYWVKFRINGRLVQKSTGTTNRTQAQEYHDRLKARLWEEERLGIPVARSWEEAVLRYLEETSHKASQGTDKTHLNWLDAYLGGMELSAITRDYLETIIKAKKAEGVQNSTVNRVLEVIRAILNKAANEWDWIPKAPKFRMLKVKNNCIRWITPQEAERLLSELPEHLKAMADFSLQTGLRRANVTGLLWSQVDLVKRRAWIHGHQAKAGKPIAVPLSERAVEIIRAQLGKHQTHIFTYRGNAVNQVNTITWRQALVRAGIKNFRWHDLRHTWASWHVQGVFTGKPTPLHVLKELGGWQTMEMVQRYAHLSCDHLAEYVDRVVA